MASAFQGFAINLNLLENTADRDVLNNLGGEPIADDILLFSNNLRNFSFLNVVAGAPPTGNIVVSLNPAENGLIQFSKITQKFVFTNKTKITVNDVVYYVGDSNNENSFRLYTNEALTNLVTTPPAGIYKRSDAVTAEDVMKLTPTRDPVIENFGLSQLVFSTNLASSASDQFTITSIDQTLYNSMIRVYYRYFGTGYPSTLNEYFSGIESQLDLYEFVKQKSINSGSDFVSSENLSLSGVITVKDPDNINNTPAGVSTTNGPGIFILNIADDTAKRIFSGNENAWTETDLGTYLTVDSNEIVIGNLVFTDSVKILRKADTIPASSGYMTVTTPIAPEVMTAASFDYYMPIFVNGEEYFLLLK